MDTDFQIVGIRNTEDQIVSRHKKWYQGKPLISALLLAVILSGCLCCHLIMTKDPGYMDLAHYNEAPGGEFLFGTDTMGRDIFSMIWYGGRISLLIGVLATFLSTVLAIVFGAVSGCAPEWVDSLLMRFTEIFLSIPNLLLVILLQAILGKASIFSISFIIGITSWPGIAKVVRTESKTDPKQRVCHRSKMYGRKLLACLMETPDSQFCLIDHVYGCHEYQKCDHCRVNLKLHGNWSAARADFVGKHAFKCRQSTDDKVMVDHPHTGSFSYSHAHVHDKSWKLFEKSCQPEGKLSVIVSVHT